MRLAAGTRLGPYEIVAPLGAGGMGEVYRAKDPNLGREVALKVLPQSLAHDAERLARFEREAKLLAQLNHPNIAHVYGLETSGETRALVMELVEGPTLAERLVRGPIPLEESLSIARQVAEALEEAHEKGIVHRDLKPQNIKASIEGRVKVLDFGLAKALDPTAGSSSFPSELAQSPTLTLGATVQGVILGTAAYMAPEQAKGLAVDKRADIWAFGVVLYEMLVGARLFDGDTVPETLAGVLKTEIDFSQLPPATPPAIRRLLARCLERNAKLRLRDIGEARVALERPGWAESPPGAPGGRLDARRERLLWAGTALLFAGLGWSAGHWTSPSAPGDVARFQILPPDGVTYNSFDGPATLAPDGRSFVFRMMGAGNKLALRRLDSLDALPLPGTERSYDPVWSPDGSQIAYFSSTALVRIDAGGLQPPQALAPVEDGRGVSWSRDGVLLFAPNPRGGLSRVAAAGGAVEAVTTLDAERKEIAHVRPQFLPDGRRFIYLVKSELPEQTGIYVGSLDGSIKRRLLPIDVAARYAAPGFLVYLQERTLVARSFDAGRLEITGDPVALANGIEYEIEFDVAPFSTSDTGLLVYHPISPSGQRRIAWFDRSGEKLADVGEAGDSNLDLDPAGTRLAIQRLDPVARRNDIWIYDLERGVSSRLTFEAPVVGPVWSPDGSRIAYESSRGSERQLLVRPASGGREELLSKERYLIEPVDWSADGRWLLVESFAPGEGENLRLVPASGGSDSVAFAATRFDEHSGRFSPDGRWIAYVSNESGRREIYVQPLPATGAKWLLSTGGGDAPRWRVDGRELYYLELDERGERSSLMAVDVDGRATEFRIGKPTPLFDAGTLDYEPAPDGQRFLIATQMGESAPPPLYAVANFPRLMARR